MNVIKKSVAIFLLVFFLVRPFFFVYAQTTAPNPTPNNLEKLKNDLTGDNFGANFGLVRIPLPGVNCGVANSDALLTQRCCNSDVVLKQNNVDLLLDLDDKIANNGGLNITLSVIKNLSTNFPLLGGIESFFLDQLSDLKTKYRQLREFQKNNPGVTCIYGEPDRAITDPLCRCVAKESSMNNRTLAKMCYQYLGNSKESGSCVSCASGGGIWTALGCIPTNIQGFITTFLLSTGIGLGGIIALICIIYAAFSIQTSRGNPEKIKKAQELLTSCIMGLMLIIFSVFILRLIGVNILRIPFLQ